MREHQSSKSTVSAPTSLTRRDALRAAMAAGVGLAAKSARAAEAVTPPAAREAGRFVPENDYPYFGYEPE